MAEPTDRVGQRFGDYWLRRRLGGGAFGDVHLGEHVHDRSLAAVKAMQMRLTRSAELRAFINEVRTFRLQHPHIVRVLDVGIASDETPFLVMEYASNGTLRDRHPKGSRLPLTMVLAYVTPLASALQYAHDRQVIHRDVKPENMLLGPDGQVWLSDFGIATVAHSTHSLTTESMGGTLPYMAPEQIQGRPRPQSDQYALAIVVYEWLTGTRPFHGTPIEIAMQHQMTPPPTLLTSVPDLPPEVEQVVLTALSKDPRDRFGSVQAFATALTQAAQAPLEQGMYSETFQEGTSTMNPSSSGATIAAEQQQADIPDLVEPPATDAFVSSIQAEPISEISPGPSAAPSESVSSSATPTPPFTLTSSPPQVTPPQSPATHPRSPSPAQPKRRRSPTDTIVVILVMVIFLGGASFGVYYGVTRTAQTSGTSTITSSITDNLHGVVWSGSQFVAVGDGDIILTSPDGSTWTAQTPGTSYALRGVVWSGSQFVAVGDRGTILTSPGGSTWTAQTPGTSDDLSGVAWSGSQFVAVGSCIAANCTAADGTILTSPDGRTWTARTPSTLTNDYPFGIVWSGSQFMAVGIGNDTIVTSPDGRTWTAQTSRTSFSLYGVAWSGSQFVVVGEGGGIVTSPDGRTWTALTPGTWYDLWGVVWSGSQFVAVGDSGTILTSPNGRTWTARTSGITDNLHGVVWSGSQFVAVGDSGAILTSPNGRTWTLQK